MHNADNAPLPNETPYRTPEPNATIPLYQGRIRVRRGAHAAEGDGLVKLHWLPTPTLQFAIPAVTSLRFGLEDCELELVDRGWSGRGGIVGVGHGGVCGQVDHVDGRLKGGSSQVAQLRLHLPNFHQVRGTPLRRKDGNGLYSGRTVFEVAPWKLTLDELNPDLHGVLKKSGGYALTHVVTCERADGVPFDPSSADDFISLLDDALSFCLGRWTGSMLAVGVDSQGALSWERWRLPWLVPYKYEHSWFPRFPTGALGALVSGYVQACADPTMRRSLRNCVHWYIEANAGHGGLEGAITMAMIGLELLSWVALVVRGGADPDDFKSAPAHVKIREYLVGQTISLDAQPLPKLVAFVKDAGCLDALEAVSRIRNRAVHPPRGKFVDYAIELREEAWRYAVYLLERAILAEVGYRGPMTERLGWTDITL